MRNKDFAPAFGPKRSLANFLDSSRSINGDDMTIQVVPILIAMVEETTAWA